MAFSASSFVEKRTVPYPCSACSSPLSAWLLSHTIESCQREGQDTSGQPQQVLSNPFRNLWACQSCMHLLIKHFCSP